MNSRIAEAILAAKGSEGPDPAGRGGAPPVDSLRGSTVPARDGAMRPRLAWGRRRAQAGPLTGHSRPARPGRAPGRRAGSRTRLSISPQDRSTRAPGPCDSVLPSAFRRRHTAPARTGSSTSTRPDDVLTLTSHGRPGRSAAAKSAPWPGAMSRLNVSPTVTVTGIVVPFETCTSISAGGVKTWTPRGSSGSTTPDGGGVGKPGISEQPAVTAAIVTADSSTDRGPRTVALARAPPAPATPAGVSRRRCGSAPAGTARRSTSTARTCRWSRSPSSRRTPARPARRRWSRRRGG